MPKSQEIDTVNSLSTSAPASISGKRSLPLPTDETDLGTCFYHPFKEWETPPASMSDKFEAITMSPKKMSRQKGTSALLVDSNAFKHHGLSQSYADVSTASLTRGNVGRLGLGDKEYILQEHRSPGSVKETKKSVKEIVGEATEESDDWRKCRLFLYVPERGQAKRVRHSWMNTGSPTATEAVSTEQSDTTNPGS